MTAVERRNVRPFFLSCSRSQSLTAWLGIALNIMIIGWCFFWLVWNYEAASLNYFSVIFDTLIALFLADLFSGFVHWSTDTWFDEIGWERTIMIAREHHLFPH